MTDKKSFFASKTFYWGTFVVFTIGFFLLGIAITLVLERRAENLLTPMVLVPVDSDEPDSEVWGKNYPREYESFKRTAMMDGLTKHGGPEPFSHLERNPALKEMFAGYPFSVEYNDDRGHEWALEDVTMTGRMDPAKGGKPMPGTCISCKTSDLPTLYKKHTPAGVFSKSFKEIRAETKHTIGCANCHDGATLNLRITNLALIEALEAQGKDPSKLTRGEMRSMVCAQCHCEYYFGEKSYLILPWKKGLSVDAIDEYYKELSFKDWTHKTSGADMVKMQHPDYELFSTGIHAYRGLACADCHMPFSSEGGVKYTNHHVQSPLKNMSNTCLVCHRISEDELKSRVEAIQDTTWKLQKRACDLVAQAHVEIGDAVKAGFAGDALNAAREKVRAAQLRADFVASSNSMGFHSPQDAARILGEAIDLAQEARLIVSTAKK
ncbi:MAG: ammonia-forming cytochrome c nitrite reductase subunit c552 [Planctomycetota bacterium]